MFGKIIVLTWAALTAITTPSLDSSRVYVDPARIESHMRETFTDVGRCPVTIIATHDGPEGTEATVVPHCSVGYPVVRFVETNDGNLLVFVMDDGKFVLLASRF